jgi:malonyl-CoA O-methyltransferase
MASASTEPTAIGAFGRLKVRLLRSWSASKPLEPRAAYERWAATYPPIAHNPVMEVEQQVVEPLLRRLGAARALDVGTGSGRYLPVLAAAAGRSVGVDFSMAMLARGSGRARVCADACRLPFSRAAFDLVNASLMVGDVKDLAGWVREMARVLTPGGHLVYSDFHPAWTRYGWTRTFRDADGALHRVALEPHRMEDHLAALAAAGLHVQAIREPRLNVRPHRAPVIVVFHATKDGGPIR